MWIIINSLWFGLLYIKFVFDFYYINSVFVIFEYFGVVIKFCNLCVCSMVWIFGVYDFINDLEKINYVNVL